MITSLHIRNFKAYRDQRFSLGRLNLLAGLNGSGKSSMLQSLLLLRQSYDQGLLEKRRATLNGDLVRLGQFKDAFFESGDERAIEINVEFALQKFECQLSGWQAGDRTGGAFFTTDTSLGTECLFEPGFRLLAAERLGPRTQYVVPDDQRHVGVGTQGEWTPFYLARHGDDPALNRGSYHPNAISDSLKHQVEAWMGEVSPGIRIHTERADTLDAVQLSYSYVAIRDVSSQYRPTNVGFGVSYALPVVTALVAAIPGDLLLIESPEAHLHPRGQAKMGELMSRAANSGVQIIVESHSDHVMNGIRVAAHEDLIRAEDVRFYYFRWDETDKTGATKVQPVVMNQDGRIDVWPEGFFDEVDRSLDILLTPKANRNA